MPDRPFSETASSDVVHMSVAADDHRVTHCGQKILDSWRYRFAAPFELTCLECKVAVDRGHVFEWDPPAVLTSMRRETCTVCGSARIIRPDGSFYGSARDRDCPE